MHICIPPSQKLPAVSNLYEAWRDTRGLTGGSGWGFCGGLEDDFASPFVEDVCVSSLVYEYHYIHTYTWLLRFQLWMWCLLILHHDGNYLLTYIFCTWRSIPVCWYAQDAGDRWLGFPIWISSHATGLANFGSGVLGMVQFEQGKNTLDSCFFFFMGI